MDLVRPERIEPQESHFWRLRHPLRPNWLDDNSWLDAHNPEKMAAVVAMGSTFKTFPKATFVADVSTTTTSPGCICGSSAFPALSASTSNLAAVRWPSGVRNKTTLPEAAVVATSPALPPTLTQFLCSFDPVTPRRFHRARNGYALTVELFDQNAHLRGPQILD